MYSGTIPILMNDVVEGTTIIQFDVKVDNTIFPIGGQYYEAIYSQLNKEISFSSSNYHTIPTNEELNNRKRYFFLNLVLTTNTYLKHQEISATRMSGPGSGQLATPSSARIAVESYGVSVGLTHQKTKREVQLALGRAALIRSNHLSLVGEFDASLRATSVKNQFSNLFVLFEKIKWDMIHCFNKIQPPNICKLPLYSNISGIIDPLIQNNWIHIGVKKSKKQDLLNKLIFLIRRKSLPDHQITLLDVNNYLNSQNDKEIKQGYYYLIRAIRHDIIHERDRVEGTDDRQKRIQWLQSNGFLEKYYEIGSSVLLVVLLNYLNNQNPQKGLPIT